MIDNGRYTSGAIALANLSASIDGLEMHRNVASPFDQLASLCKLYFVRGDHLGRIADHDRAEAVAIEAIAIKPQSAGAIYLSAHLGARFHRFKQAGDLLEKARSRGHPRDQVDSEDAALLQATGHYEAALVLRRRLAQERPSIQTIGALASLLAEMGDWRLAERNYAAALEADDGVSPLPAAQLLFEWGVSAMRQGQLEPGSGPRHFGGDARRRAHPRPVCLSQLFRKSRLRGCRRCTPASAGHRQTEFAMKRASLRRCPRDRCRADGCR